MKITNEKKIPGTIMNNKKNLESYILIPTVIIHPTNTTIPEGILEKKLRHSVGHWQQVLINVLKGPGVLTGPGHRFQFVPHNIVPNKTVFFSSKALKPGIDLAFSWMRVLSGIHFQNTEISFILNICPGK